MSIETAQASTAYPTTRDEVSAVSLARHYAARSLAAFNLITDPNAPGRTGHLASQHLDTFVAAALLIRLNLVDDSDPDDEVAKTLWDAMAHPPETVVMLGHWLREMGIDPDSLPTPALKPTADAAEVDRLRAERENIRYIALHKLPDAHAAIDRLTAERDRYAAALDKLGARIHRDLDPDSAYGEPNAAALAEFAAFADECLSVLDRTGAAVGAVPLDDDGYPHALYAEDVCHALWHRGISATDPHYEEPWERQVTLPLIGAYEDCAWLRLCWMADQEDPSRGEGWFITHRDDEDGPVRITPLIVAHHATPGEVAAEVRLYLLDEPDTNAAATSDQPAPSDGPAPTVTP